MRRGADSKETKGDIPSSFKNEKTLSKKPLGAGSNVRLSESEETKRDVFSGFLGETAQNRPQTAPGPSLSLSLSSTLVYPSMYTPPRTPCPAPHVTATPCTHRATWQKCHLDPRSGRIRWFPNRYILAFPDVRGLSVQWRWSSNNLCMPGKINKMLQEREILFSGKKAPSADRKLF